LPEKTKTLNWLQLGATGLEMFIKSVAFVHQLFCCGAAMFDVIQQRHI
jgi:hypothetical protein